MAEQVETPSEAKQSQTAWPGPSAPANEQERLAATRQLQLLGEQDHPALQRFVDITAQILERSIVMLTLLDEDHVRILNAHADFDVCREEPRRSSICAWTLLPDSPEVLMIEDLSQDARFSDHALVTQAPFLRTYLSAPILLTNGHRVGTLCTLDTASTSLNASASRLLVNVAALVARQLEGFASSEDEVPLPVQAGQGLRQQGLMLLDVSQPGWPILLSDCDAQGFSAKRTEGQSFWDVFAVHHVADPENLFKATLAKGKAFRVKAAVANHHDGEQCQLSFRPGDGSLPEEWVPNVSHVGTPAWISSPSLEGQAQAIKHWFVIVTQSGDKTAQQPHIRFGSDAVCDTISKDAESASLAEDSALEGQPADVQGGWEDVEVGYLVGRGCTGSVYRAMCKGQRVAVKIIAPSHSKYIKRAPDGTPMEVALTQDLQHPNIVHVLRHASFPSQNASLAVLNDGSNWSMASSGSQWIHELADQGNDLDDDNSQDPAVETWLLLEYCDKGCLSDAIDRGWLLTQGSHNEGHLCLKRLLLTALELATALAYLHGVDIMHGDLTGGNVLLHSAPVTSSDPRGFIVKVADFGMSRIGSDLMPTAQGTITHMPPELLREGQMHQSADVWSFGVLLWEMYHGQRSWHGKSLEQLMQAIGREKQTLQWPASGSAGLMELGRSCFCLDPDERPTFRQLVQQLESILEQYSASES